MFKEFAAALEREGVSRRSRRRGPRSIRTFTRPSSRARSRGSRAQPIIEVYRRGYLLKGQLLRPAMVVVGRPVDRVEPSGE